MTDQLSGREFHITGVVQGVGFRPFVYGLAQEYALTGWVRNTSAGVELVVDGRIPSLDSFAYDLKHKLPPLARIDGCFVQERPSNGFTQFEIMHSEAIEGAFQPISPDVSICPDCLRELFDPHDRRYLYPFINCTNCGPRFTIIQDIPYDRPNTTMAPFTMCDACAAEYNNPLDRRFHAQPVACPDCGPGVSFQFSVFSEEVASGKWQVASELRNTQYAIRATQKLLADGKILAVKGLGGFHLACDALNDTTVSTLRERKNRGDKPFALMMPDVATIEQYCYVNNAERELLTSRERPIVLLKPKPSRGLSPHISPKQATLGVMLPYTPLHYLLLAPLPRHPAASASVLVMTSGNLSEEPIAYTNEDALVRLAPLADAFLLHDRDIHVRCDDSVVRSFGIAQDERGHCVEGRSCHASHYVLRRSRGYAPTPIHLAESVPSLLATGAELKNTFCLTRDQYAFMSHHIGDLENYETLVSFEEGIAHFEKLFRITPELIAYDKHPNYLATRYALERAKREGIPAIGVQHHHAHIAACMAEHGLLGERPVIGVALDGTGYGDDGTIWGGEFLVADYAGFERPYFLRPIPLPGGDTAVRQPWRIALAYLHQAGINWDDDLPSVNYALRTTQHASLLDALKHQLLTGTNAPLTSSMGRLFDGVAALLGVRQVVNYEAQAAIELEALVHGSDTAVYPLNIINGRINPAPMFAQIVVEMRSGVETAVIATRFHNTISWLVTHICQRIRQETSLNEVVLSGGVWQNSTLLHKTIPQLDAVGFDVYWHQQLPTNDGGLALGQAMIAAKNTNPKGFPRVIKSAEQKPLGFL